MLTITDGGYQVSAGELPAVSGTTIAFLRWSLYDGEPALAAPAARNGIATLDDQLTPGPHDTPHHRVATTAPTPTPLSLTAGPRAHRRQAVRRPPSFVLTVNMTSTLDFVMLTSMLIRTST